jgi:hypothetical protein
MINDRALREFDCHLVIDSISIPNHDIQGRQELRDLVGEEAENLIWKFCVIDRKAMEELVLKDGIPEAGLTFRHIRTGWLTV